MSDDVSQKAAIELKIAMKTARDKAMKGTCDKLAISLLMFAELQRNHFFSTTSKLTIHERVALQAYILSTIETKGPSKKKGSADQLDLLVEYDSIVIAIQRFDDTTKKYTSTDMVKLGNFKMREIEQHEKQQSANIKAAEEEKMLYDLAREKIVPVLRANPEMNWREAAQLLKASSV